MNQRVEGSVAQILNTRELVINRGSNDGVEVGMRFAVLNRKGVEIRDPETGESLGSVEVEKVVVKIVRVEARVSVGRTFKQFRTGGLGIPDLLGPRRTVVETLKTTETTYKEELDEADSFIKIGDPVVEVRGDEFLPEEKTE